MTERYDLVIHAPRAITPDGEVACTVAVRDETVVAVEDFGADLVGDRVLRLVDPAQLHHKNAVTPYAGRTLTGRVRSTWLRGIDIIADVESNGDRYGRLLRRGVA